MEATRGVAGLFYTSLDRQQTSSQTLDADDACDDLTPWQRSRMDAIERMYGHAPPTAEPHEVAFRHSGWQRDRQRVANALVASNAPRAVQERFAVCGSDAVVEWSPTLKRHRIKAYYCGHRCCKPCANARAQRTIKKLCDLARGKEAAFLTLTITASDADVTDCINHIYESFARLRRSVLWLSAVDGGAAVPEIKRGRTSGKWHVHLHAILIAKYIDQRKLAEAWCKASGGSYIVHIRRIKDDEREIGYVAAYAGKGFDQSVLRSPDDLLQCLIALRGRRLYLTFGTWYRLDLDRDEESADDWKRIGRLGHIIRGGVANDPSAIGILRSLNVEVVDSGFGLIFARSGPYENG